MKFSSAILPALFAAQAVAFPVVEKAVQAPRDVDASLTDLFYIGLKEKRDAAEDKRDVDASLTDLFYIGLKH